MRTLKVALALLIVGAAAPAAAKKPAAPVEKVPADPRVEKMLTEFLGVMTVADDKARVQAILPMLHKSLKTKDGKDLLPKIRDGAFKKASNAAGNYAQPAQIKEVHKGEDKVVGKGDDAEKGRVDKYLVERHENAGGVAAPIQVIFPENGALPRILDFSSL